MQHCFGVKPGVGTIEKVCTFHVSQKHEPSAIKDRMSHGFV